MLPIFILLFTCRAWHINNKMKIGSKFWDLILIRLMKTQDKNTQISVYCIQHYCKESFGIIKQLLPALAVNIIIVHPCDVVFPRDKAIGKRTPLWWTIMMFTVSAVNNCIVFTVDCILLLSSNNWSFDECILICIYIL